MFFYVNFGPCCSPPNPSPFFPVPPLSFPPLSLFFPHSRSPFFVCLRQNVSPRFTLSGQRRDGSPPPLARVFARTNAGASGGLGGGGRGVAGPGRGGGVGGWRGVAWRGGGGRGKRAGRGRARGGRPRAWGRVAPVAPLGEGAKRWEIESFRGEGGNRAGFPCRGGKRRGGAAGETARDDGGYGPGAGGPQGAAGEKGQDEGQNPFFWGKKTGAHEYIPNFSPVFQKPGAKDILAPGL